MDKIVFRSATTLKEHPRNLEIFGSADKDPELFQEIVGSIIKNGIQEPIIIKDDGTVLSGHIRLAAFLHLLTKDFDSWPGLCRVTMALLSRGEVPVRVHEDFESEDEELSYLIFSNTQRRQLTILQRNKVYKFLRELDERSPVTPPKEKPKGRPKGAKTEKEKTRQRVDLLSADTGVSVRTLQRDSELLGHPLCTDTIKGMLDRKELAQSTAREAINEAVEHAKREKRSPNEADVLVFIANPVTKAPRATATLAEVLKSKVKTPVEPAVVPAKPEKVAKKATKTETPVEVETSVEIEVPLEVETSVEVEVPVETTILVPTEVPTPKVPEEKPTTVIVNLPTTLVDQLQLCLSIIEGIDEVEDPSTIRDLLLDLSMKAKDAAKSLSRSKATFEPNGLVCALCGKPQFETPSGASCENGHGGEDGMTLEEYQKSLLKAVEPPKVVEPTPEPPKVVEPPKTPKAPKAPKAVEPPKAVEVPKATEPAKKKKAEPKLSEENINFEDILASVIEETPIKVPEPVPPPVVEEAEDTSEGSTDVVPTDVEEEEEGSEEVTSVLAEFDLENIDLSTL